MKMRLAFKLSSRVATKFQIGDAALVSKPIEKVLIIHVIWMIVSLYTSLNFYTLW